MKLARSIAACTAIVLVIGCGTVGDIKRNATEQDNRQAVKYRTLSIEDYFCFPKNWDDNKYPVLYALISNPQQWQTIFGAAPVMGMSDEDKFEPDKNLYNDEQILVVSQVVNPHATFTVENIFIHKNELTLRYQTVDLKTGSGSNIKMYIPIVIPKHDYKKVSFIRDGKPVGTLDVEHEQWSVPMMSSNI